MTRTTTSSNNYATGLVGLRTTEITKYDVERKGFLTQDQLGQACADLGVDVSNPATLDAIMRNIDQNRSGKVSSYEFGKFYDAVQAGNYSSYLQ